MRERVWLTPQARPEADLLARELGLPLPLARVLANRGISAPEEGRRFLYGTIDDLRDPYLLSGMKAAVTRVRQAIDRKERILVFGDYDADGVLSVVMLLKALGDLGAEVDYFIPARLRDGYGLKADHIDVVIEKKASLVISVDCGIKAHEFVARARAAGVDVIVTDHHLPDVELPPAVAVLNPVLPDSGYPDKNLAGVGVVFKLLEALLRDHAHEPRLDHYLKLVSVGTIADVAELRGENRLFVKAGLKGLEKAVNPGLKSLLEVCGLRGQRVSEGDVAFRLGPRLNAAGRMESADLAVELFQTASPDKAREIVRRLDELNALRQKTEEGICDQARKKIEEEGLDRGYRVLVLGSEAWHRGIIGIVASRLKEEFHRPVILFSYENGIANGSGRSIREFSLIDCLDHCKSHFLNYGGHRLAVGCSLLRENMDAFRAEVNAFAAARLSDEDLARKVRLDAVLDPGEITPEFLEKYALLEPFGVGNATPVFMTEKVRVVRAPQRLQGRHCKLVVHKGSRQVEAIGWDKGDWAATVTAGDRLDLAYSLQFSSYFGAPRPYLCLEDIRS
jgi:single-stranded-DNA-specific exonuclease